MIVEYIGSTGAGKTTLASGVQRRLAETADVETSFDLAAELLGLQRVTNPTVRNLICDLVGFPFFIRSMYRHKEFIIFALKHLARHNNFTFFAVNYLRSIVRKIGMYEMIRRYESGRIILVDEGTVLAAHNLFVYTSAVYIPEEIIRFASLVPLPEVVVYVKASVNSLVQRSLQRNDPPREMRSKNQKLIERYARRAVKVFEQLVEAEEIRDRVLIVKNTACAYDKRGTAADHIAEFILNYQTSQRIDGHSPSAANRERI